MVFLTYKADIMGHCDQKEQQKNEPEKYHRI